MKIAVISANMGNFETLVPHVPQSVECDFFIFDESNFPLRKNSMMPRLQARIPKMFAWQMKEGYDIYIWIDGSCSFQHPDSVKWLLEKMGDMEMAVLKHPHRKSIQEEYEYLKHRLTFDEKYIIPRYEGELLEEQMKEIKSDRIFQDDHLFASTVFIYRNKPAIQRMLKDWWYHTSRYHSIDQLSLPYVLWKHGIFFNVIDEKYMETPYITYTRKKK